MTEDVFLKEAEEDDGPTLSDESAEGIVQKFLAYYDIDLDDPSVDDAEMRGVKTSARKMKRAIMRGDLEILEDGDNLVIDLHLRKPPKKVDKTIRFRELDGKAKSAMKEIKGEYDHHGRVYALMANLSHGALSLIKARELQSVDLGLVESIGILFLQV